MKRLAEECGGSEQGLHGFVPNCTILYNMPGPVQIGRKMHREERKLHEVFICDDGAKDLNGRHKAGQELLERCLEHYNLERDGSQPRSTTAAAA